jgi:uncharacterized iron-regulated membrane protein
MGAFTSAFAPFLGATRVPLNAVTVLLGLAGMALGGWLLWMSRSFTEPERPTRREPEPSRRATADELADDTTVT